MIKLENIKRPVVAAVVMSAWLYGCGDSDAQMPQGGDMPPPAVSVMELKREEVLIEQQLPGRTVAYKIAEIRPQVNGVIMERHFTEGKDVKAGQQLYLIDPAIYRAAYESAQAELQRARANAQAVQSREKRYADLVEIDAVSKQEYDDVKASLAQAKADIAVAEANMRTAKVNLDYTKVYSPIDGRIGKSTVTEGALVTANQAEMLARVTQLDPIFVDMQQSSADLMRIREKIGEERELPVRLLLEGGREYPHEGVLQFSEVTVDATTSSVQLRALFPNPDGVLLPGLFVQAKVELAREDALLVPQKATMRDKNGQLLAWRVDGEGTANPAPVQVTREYKDKWIVESGLSVGDVIVTEGFQKIQPGAKVNPTSASAQAEQRAIEQAGEAVDDADAADAMQSADGPAAATPATQTDDSDSPAAQE